MGDLYLLNRVRELGLKLYLSLSDIHRHALAPERTRTCSTSFYSAVRIRKSTFSRKDINARMVKISSVSFGAS